MKYEDHYSSPLGEMLMEADEDGLTGLWFCDQKTEEKIESSEKKKTCDEAVQSVFSDTKRWLDLYFSGKDPGFAPKLHTNGSPFQQRVLQILCDIPYGRTKTYKEIADQIAAERGIKKMASQAVGGAVGNNPISLIIPCHRVVGAHGNLTGYGGGMDRKEALLRLEGAYQEHFHRPKKKNP